MIRRPFWTRTLSASAAIAAAIALASCQTEGMSPSTKAMKPLSYALVNEIEQKNMEKTSPILVRLFKQEAELEIWKQDRSGRYALLKTYPICRWSGELGPKIKEGDRQAPEGFYSITPAQMNPNSAYYLSFNLGYPNAFDKAWGRTGSQLMVHGDCSSRGCYAMTDEQIAEIYALGRESFFGGQRAFQVQAYPFRMTALNMAKHRNNPHMPFWKMLKQGYDHFEVTKFEPKVDVCEKRYVFNASAPEASIMANSSPALNFNPAGKCPVFEVPAEIAEAVNEKQRRDEIQIAELTRRNTPTAPIRTNTDGGMNPVFLAALNAKGQEIRDPDGNIRALAAPISAAPGTIPAHVNPPREPQPQYAADNGPESSAAIVADVPVPRAAPQRKDGARPAQGPSFAEKLGNLFSAAKPAAQTAPVRVASVEANAQPEPPKKGNFFSRLFNSSGASEQKAAAPTPARESPGPRSTRAVGLRGSEPAVKPAPASAKEAARPQPKPAEADPRPPAPVSIGHGGLLAGAQPVLPASSFDSRWGALR